MYALLYSVLLANLAAAAPSVNSATSPCKLRPPGTVKQLPCGIRILSPLGTDPYRYLNEGLPQRFASVEGCANLCAGRRLDIALHQTDAHDEPFYDIYCTSFYYNEVTGFCQLLADHTGPSKLQRSNTSDVVFYNGRCFDCGRPCDQPVGKQLIYDGDFQRELLGPWFSSNGSVAFGKHSKNMYQCSSRTEAGRYQIGGATTTIACILLQTFNGCPNRFYSVSFDYRLPSAEHEFQALNVKYSTDFVHTAIIANGTVDTSWKKFVGFMLAEPKDDYYTIFISPGLQFEFEHPSGDQNSKDLLYELDNVRVTRIPENVAVKSGATSIVSNGGFENGNLAPWILEEDSIYYNAAPRKAKFEIVKPGIQSNRALKVFPGSTSYAVSLAQRIVTQPGVQYLLTFDYSPSGVQEMGYITPVGYSLTLSGVINPDGTAANQTQVLFVPPNDPEASITSAAIPFSGLENMTTLSFAVTVQEPGEILPVVLIDNISVKPLAKPLG